MANDSLQQKRDSKRPGRANGISRVKCVVHPFNRNSFSQQTSLYLCKLPYLVQEHRKHPRRAAEYGVIMNKAEG